MIKSSRRLSMAVGLALVFLLTTGILKADAAAAPAGALEAVSFTFEWMFAPFPAHHHGFWIAKERGWYREEGLDVTLNESRGDAQAVQLLLTGKHQFALVTGLIVTESVAKGAPIKVVALFHPRSPAALRYLKRSGIRTPKDIEGRTLGQTAGGQQAIFWPAYAKAAGIDIHKVNRVMVDGRIYVQLLLQGKLDVTNGIMGAIEDVKLAKQGFEVGNFPYADYIPIIGTGIVAHLDTIQNRPDLVQRFVRATRRAWDFLEKNPKEAIAEAAQIAAKRIEGAPDPKDTIQAVTQITPRYMRSKFTVNRPVGWMANEDWEGMLRAVEELKALPSIPPLDRLFTNQFITVP